jgi:predicted deacetylase
MHTSFEVDAAKATSRYRSEKDEVTRTYEKIAADLRAQNADADAKHLHEVERLKMDLRVVQDALNASQTGLEDLKRT